MLVLKMIVSKKQRSLDASPSPVEVRRTFPVGRYGNLTKPDIFYRIAWRAPEVAGGNLIKPYVFRKHARADRNHLARWRREQYHKCESTRPRPAPYGATRVGGVGAKKAA